MTLRDDTDTSAYDSDTLEKDFRVYFSALLKGSGLDIGPLHRPMITHDGMRVTYVDQFPVEILREHYPELKDQEIIAPDIICNAELLNGVDTESYDFVIAAHVIEHMRNPISAISNWLRVIRSGGQLYLVIPDKRKIFDKMRLRTSLAHLINDYQNPLKSRDEEHYIDYALHVDHKADGNEALEWARHLEIINYSIHYHVFLPKDINELLKWYSVNVHPITLLEGPIMGLHDTEFHVLIQKI